MDTYPTNNSGYRTSIGGFGSSRPDRHRRMNRVASHHFAQLVAGQLCAAVLLAGLPGILLFWLFDLAAGPTALLCTLAALHAASLTGQIASSGTWVPERWNAVLFLILLPADLAGLGWLATAGEWTIVLPLALLSGLAAHAARQIVLNWRFNGWRGGSAASGAAGIRTRTSQATGPRRVDDDSPLPF